MQKKENDLYESVGWIKAKLESMEKSQKKEVELAELFRGDLIHMFNEHKADDKGVADKVEALGERVGGLSIKVALLEEIKGVVHKIGEKVEDIYNFKNRIIWTSAGAIVIGGLLKDVLFSWIKHAMAFGG